MRFLLLFAVLLALAGVLVWAAMGEGGKHGTTRWPSLASFRQLLAPAPRRPRSLARPGRRRRRDWRVYFDETLELTSPAPAADRPAAVVVQPRAPDDPSRATEVIGGVLRLLLFIPLLGAAVAAAVWAVASLVTQAISAAVNT